MDEKQRIVHDFYAARDRRDWHAVRQLLAEDVVWHEGAGDQDYSGNHHGRETVAELLEKLVHVTGGTFTLEARHLIATDEHIAATVRWRAGRSGTEIDGNEIAVYRITDGQIGEAWFFPDSNDPQALSRVFSFSTTQ